MTDGPIDPLDELAALRAQLDQNAAGLTGMAGAYADIYKRLHAAGVPEASAARILESIVAALCQSTLIETAHRVNVEMHRLQRGDTP